MCAHATNITWTFAQICWKWSHRLSPINIEKLILEVFYAEHPEWYQFRQLLLQTFSDENGFIDCPHNTEDVMKLILEVLYREHPEWNQFRQLLLQTFSFNVPFIGCTYSNSRYFHYTGSTRFQFLIKEKKAENRACPVAYWDTVHSDENRLDKDVLYVHTWYTTILRKISNFLTYIERQTK